VDLHSTERINAVNWVVFHVGVGIDAAAQSAGVVFYIASDLCIRISVVVVVQPGLRIVILTGEPKVVD
jgi:hypothetical protein